MRMKAIQMATAEPGFRWLTMRSAYPFPGTARPDARRGRGEYASPRHFLSPLETDRMKHGRFCVD